MTSDAFNFDIDGSFTLNWTESQFAETYSIYKNDILLISDLADSQTNYEVSGKDSEIHEFFLKPQANLGIIHLIKY